MSLLHRQQDQQEQQQLLLQQQQHIYQLRKTEQQLQQQASARNLNLEALSLLKRGDCGLAFLRWRQALQVIRDPYQGFSDAQDMTAASYTQECIQSVEMHPELVSQINGRACPENMFPMFCRTFTVTSTTSPNTISQAIDASVVLYNIGFAYHLAAMSNDARQRICRLEQAYSFYSAAEKGISDLFSLQDIASHHSYSMMLVLALAISVNKGHFHALFLQQPEVQQCRDRIAAIHRMLVNTIAAQSSIDSCGQLCRELALRSGPTQEESAYILGIVFEATSLRTFHFAAPMA